MSDLYHPKVLVVGINPWIDNTGINTLISFFKCWDKASIAHVYTRAKLPNTHVCNKFFRISEPKVMHSIIDRRIKTGETVVNSSESDKSSEQEANVYKRKHSEFMAFARELVWLFGKWKSKELKQFLDEYEPDVLFFPVYSTVYMNRLQNYIKMYTSKPVILYVSDDNYSYKSISKTPISFLHRFWLRNHEKKLFKSADDIMVISPKQKDEYDELFDKNCKILTKGIDFSRTLFEEKTPKYPIKMVYTGKLIIGRWLSLSKIAEAMGRINETETRITLDIYTTDALTEEQNRLLNRNGCMVKGALRLDEVQTVQKEADVLVFVESLENKYKNTARLSFSTKITDYLKNGKCIFAIGDEDIAPIDYFNRYDSAVTACSYDEIERKIEWLVNNPEKIFEYSKKAYECGKAHHSKEEMDKLLVETICNVAGQ